MRTLLITHQTYLDMIGHGNSNTEQEMCGVLLGFKSTERTWQADEFVPITNVDEETNYQHYTLDPQEFMDVLSKTPHAGGDGKHFVGIFHTHPHNKPIPSSFDIDGAGYNVFYIIYSPKFNSITTHFCTETGESWKTSELQTYGK